MGECSAGIYGGRDPPRLFQILVPAGAVMRRERKRRSATFHMSYTTVFGALSTVSASADDIHNLNPVARGECRDATGEGDVERSSAGAFSASAMAWHTVLPTVRRAAGGLSLDQIGPCDQHIVFSTRRAPAVQYGPVWRSPSATLGFTSYMCIYPFVMVSKRRKFVIRAD
jgi:hypothetical protein